MTVILPTFQMCTCTRSRKSRDAVTGKIALTMVADQLTRAVALLAALVGHLFSTRRLLGRRRYRPDSLSAQATGHEPSTPVWSDQPFGQYLEDLASDQGLLRREW